MERVSVIIPTRDRGAYVNDLLLDLHNQAVMPHELIVVDQSVMPTELKGCIYITDNQTGPCHARNLGIMRASGDILLFLDDDIRLEADFIQKIVKSFESPSVHAVTFANCSPAGEYPFQTSYDYLNQDTDNWFKLLTANPNFPGKRCTLSFPAGCSAIRKTVVHEVGGFDTFFDPTGAGEDREYGYRLFKMGYRVVYDGSPRILHLGAPKGGSRDLGSRRLNLDLNIGYAIGKHFNYFLFRSYKKTILSNYRLMVIKKLGRTSIKNYLWVSKRFREVERLHFVHKARRND